jgi:hypothetical protein
MYGVTGRMGINQHLVVSIVAIRQQGGVALPNGDRGMPDPIPVGRNAGKVAALAREYGIERFTTDLDAALKNPGDEVFFDAATTQMRADLLTRFYKTGSSPSPGSTACRIISSWSARKRAPSLLHLAELFRLADKNARVARSRPRRLAHDETVGDARAGLDCRFKRKRDDRIRRPR